ncbi:MAG: hypothetical protein VKJ24_17425 [Synechococcales bacterium]|nr:hypothetical protein [Synechococcales bacterium]
MRPPLNWDAYSEDQSYRDRIVRCDERAIVFYWTGRSQAMMGDRRRYCRDVPPERLYNDVGQTDLQYHRHQPTVTCLTKSTSVCSGDRGCQPNSRIALTPETRTQRS